jgi:hypothetical protein
LVGFSLKVFIPGKVGIDVINPTGKGAASMLRPVPKFVGDGESLSLLNRRPDSCNRAISEPNQGGVATL